MKVNDIMTPNPECCTPDDSLIDCAKIMEKIDVGFVPVVESRDTRRAIGVVTDRDIVVRAVAQGKDPQKTTIKQVMTDDLVCIDADSDAARAKELMEEYQIKRVLVCDEQNCVIGVLSLADEARELSEQEVGEMTKSISSPSGTPTI
jgi:CBS domain-containing protein